MSALAYTPRDDLRNGDIVKLTGDQWAVLDSRGEEAVIEGEGMNATVHLQGDDWFVFDPKVYSGHLVDWSVQRVEA